MTGPRTLGNHIVPTLRRAAADAGRTARVVAGLIVCVTDDAAAARDHVNREFAANGSAAGTTPAFMT